MSEKESKILEKQAESTEKRQVDQDSENSVRNKENKHLDEATLEDLEDLIAASAKRLASYRLLNEKIANKKNQEIGRWKELLEDGEMERPQPRKVLLEKEKPTTTRSECSTTSPKIDSPRTSSSTRATAKTPHSKKPTQDSKEENNPDYDGIEQYLNTFEKPSIKIPRKPKLSITNNVSSKTTAKKPKDSKTVPPVTKRKRGKTLPGSLAAPSGVAPLSLPPMKVEPLPSSKTSRNIAKTPTKIPLPSFSSKHKKEQALSNPKSEKPTRKPRPPNTPITPKLQKSKSNKSIDENLLRKKKVSTQPILGKSSASATTTTSKLANTTSSKSTGTSKKVYTLHSRLQGLVEESKSWTTNMEKEKLGGQTEIILRGKGPLAGTEDKKSVPKVLMRVAMSPEAAQKLYQFNLTSYEKTEMASYDQIYFVGHHAQKRPASPTNTACNFGYDDDRGDYLIQLRDHLDYCYEVIQIMGKGSFGQVLKCFDHRSGQTVAIKIIRNKKRFHAQALTEIKILEDLLKWDPDDRHNNVRILGHFTFRNHLCITFECLSINLYEFIKTNGYQGFNMGLIKRFASQLLNSLVLLQKRKLIHCDLKPENILLKHTEKTSIKVIDFGSSCLQSEKVYTYIQSRFYRSPEVIMGINYSMAIDMWSAGCIVAELHTGYPLFPGENEQQQLACIMEILHTPDSYLIEKSSRRKLFFDSLGNPRIIPNSKGRKRKPGSKSLEHALNSSDRLFIDFVKQCLIWDPEKRIKPDEALKHPWILKAYTKK